MDTRSAEIAVLKWAAGNLTAIPPDVTFDADRLLTAVNYHHLSSRFHHRLGRDRPVWADRALVDAVRELDEAARVRSRRQFEDAAHLTADLLGKGIDVVVLKGVSHYLHTRDSRALAWSGDVDLLPADAERALIALVAAGFTVDDKDPPQPHGRKVFHEFAKLHRDGLEVDLHAHFPVWKYPELDGRTVPAGNPGVWRCASSVRRHGLTAADVLASSVHGTWDSASRIPMCGREMTALVSACHVFASYLSELTREYATVRLGELANIALLVRSDSFDWASFRRLAQQHRAVDAVSAAVVLVDHCLGTDLGSTWFQDLPRPTRLPRDLWFARGEGGLLVDVREVEDLDDLLLMHTSIGNIVHGLGANPVSAGEGRDWSVMSAAGQPLERVLVADTAGDSLGFHMSFTWRPASLHLSVSVPAQPLDVELDVHLNFRDVVYELVRHSPHDTFAYSRLVRERRVFDIPVRAWADEREQHFQAEVPWTALGQDAPPQRGLQLLLGVRAWEPDGSRPRASTIVPLAVTPG